MPLFCAISPYPVQPSADRYWNPTECALLIVIVCAAESYRRFTSEFFKLRVEPCH